MKKRIFILLIVFLFAMLIHKEDVMANDTTEEIPSIDNLLSKYFNNGVYRKDTKINLNEDGITDLKQHFHVETSLERTTYYLNDSLWMSKDKSEDSLYSFYGTKYEDGKAVGLTYGTTYNYLTYPKEVVVALFGEGQNSMEEYYTTLKDIKEAKVSWDYIDGVYVTTNDTMLKYFLDFTAPCLYESIINTHVFSYEKATIEIDENNDLLLKLWVSSIDYGYVEGREEAIVDGCVILSAAIIKNPEIKGVKVDYYPSLSNADIIAFNGNIYTYGGNFGVEGRTNNIYCYNIKTNTVYELDAKISTPATSHRIHLYGGKVFIFGGLAKSGKVMDIQVHDLVNQTCEVLELPMPYGMNCEQLGYYGDKVYLVGGSTSVGSNKIFEVDINTLEFTELDFTLPFGIFKGGWCNVGKYLYIFGGTNGPRLTSIVRFDMEEKTIKVMDAQFPVQLSQSRAAYDGNGNIYIYGGTLEGNILVDTIYKYNIEKDSIELLPYTLPVKIANTCVVNVGGTIYILAGDNDTNDLILAHKDDQLIDLKTYYKKDIE